jgi:hypothetical protein
MSSLDQAVETQIRNIQTKTGKTLEELSALVQQSGLSKHSEIRAMLQQTLGIGYGDANALVHVVRQSDGQRAAESAGTSIEEVIDGLYTGKKAALRPIHDRLMAAIATFGECEIVPKKGYISLRRRKQFAMIGPRTNTRVEIGLNVRHLEGDERLKAMPAGAMCQYQINLQDVAEIDDAIIGWIRAAFESAE